MNVRHFGFVFVMMITVAVAPISHQPAHALMEKASVAELAAEADYVVQGEVTSITSFWNADRTAIVTDVTMRVVETVGQRAGSAAMSAEVVFRVDGGEVEGIGMRTSNSPVFRPGEQAIVFLERGTAAALTIVGKREGVFRIQNGRLLQGKSVLDMSTLKAEVRSALQ